MFKDFFLITILIYFSSCGQTSSYRNFKPRSEKKDTVSVDSIKEGVLKFQRRYLSKKTNLPTSINQFIVIGHEPFDSAVGDINDDNIPDVLLVTSIINEDSVNISSIKNNKRIHFDSTPLRRQLLILIGKLDGLYNLVCRNLKAIPCLDCCGMTDAFGAIAIKNGQIIITEYCASNCKGIFECRFKYLKTKKNWYLDKIIEESYCFNLEDYSLDTMTKKDFGKISISKFDIDKDLE